MEPFITLLAIMQIHLFRLELPAILLVLPTVRLVSVYFRDVRGQVVLRGAGFQAVGAGDVLVAFVHSVHVLPQVRGSPVTFIAEIAREEAVNDPSMITQFL